MSPLSLAPSLTDVTGTPQHLTTLLPIASLPLPTTALGGNGGSPLTGALPTTGANPVLSALSPVLSTLGPVTSGLRGGAPSLPLLPLPTASGTTLPSLPLGTPSGAPTVSASSSSSTTSNVPVPVPSGTPTISGGLSVGISSSGSNSGLTLSLP
jgi:hypothetical protein